MANSEFIWNRIVAPDDADLPPEVARYLLSLGISAEDKSRYQWLSSQEQSELSPEDRAELASLVEANTVLMLFQAKARLSLKQRQPAA